jgi:regulatory protein
VTQEEINHALDSIDDDAEYQSAFELAMKKYSTMSRLESDVQIRRIQSLLQRKGFGFPVIARVMKELGIGVDFSD